MAGGGDDRPVLPGSEPVLVGNVSVELTRFVGRSAELGALQELVGEARLITLTGPGGVGKTRLALELAARVAPRFAHGVWCVELAPVASPESVASAILTALGRREDLGGDATTSLANQLQHHDALVVLDNCEQVVAGTAAVVDRLLRCCRGVRVLATSREALGVEGELTWLVPPLGVPQADTASREAIEGCESVQLFVDRARRARSNFSMTGDDMLAVAEICRRLDGLPLAVELAAARARMLTPTQIEGALEDRFRLLTGGVRTALPRQQTMRASVDWSHDLLAEEERVLFRRLAAFAEWFGLDAAEAVAGFEPLARPAVLDLLASLVDRSLVIVDTKGGAARYRLLETVRHYARERLDDAGETALIRGRHARWHLALADDGSATDHAELSRRVEPIVDDLLAATTWAQQHDADLAGRIGVALARHWRGHGRIGEAVRLLDRIGDPPDPHVRAVVHEAHGALLVLNFQGGARERARVAAALEVAREVGDGRLEASALNTLAWLELDARGRQTLELLSAAADAAGRMHDDWTLGHALYGLGFLNYMQLNDLEAARSLAGEALGVASRSGNDIVRLLCMIAFAACDEKEGDFARARSGTEAAVASARSVGDRWSEAFALAASVRMAVWLGDYGTAAELVEQAVPLATQIGGAPRTHLGLARAMLALAQGRHEEALARWAELVRMEEDALPFMAGVIPEYEAYAHLASGDTATARRRCDELLGSHSGGTGRTLGLLVASAAIARAEGDLDRAEAELKRVFAQVDRARPPFQLDALHTLAGVRAELGRAVPAVRLYAAVATGRRTMGYVMFLRSRQLEDADLAGLQQTLGPEAFAAASAEGRAMSLRDALAYARRGHGPRRRPTTGWDALTPTEIQVVELVAEGLSNPQVAERLFMARRTVTTHLTHIFDKLGLRSRTELAVEVARRRPPAATPRPAAYDR